MRLSLTRFESIELTTIITPRQCLLSQEQSLSTHHVHVDMAIANVILKKVLEVHFSFGLTPNVIAQTSVKVTMSSRFQGLVGSLPLEKQQQVQEMYTVQDHPPPPSEFLILPPLNSLYK
jgi:hypothetical protein